MTGIIFRSTLAEGDLVAVRERECSDFDRIKKTGSNSLKVTSESEYRMDDYTVCDQILSAVATAMFADDDGIESSK